MIAPMLQNVRPGRKLGKKRRFGLQRNDRKRQGYRRLLRKREQAFQRAVRPGRVIIAPPEFHRPPGVAPASDLGFELVPAGR